MVYLETLYVLITQLFVAVYWILTNNIRKIKSRLDMQNLFVIVAYNAWIIVFVTQLFLGPIFMFNTNYNFIVKYSGLFLYTIGVFLALWSKKSLGKSWGLPEIHLLKDQKELVTNRGPYKYIRNPIYLSEMIMLLGFEMWLNSWFVLLIVPFYLFNLRKAISEEKELLKSFGKPYLNYVNKTKRFL